MPWNHHVPEGLWKHLHLCSPWPAVSVKKIEVNGIERGQITEHARVDISSYFVLHTVQSFEAVTTIKSNNALLTDPGSEC